MSAAVGAERVSAVVGYAMIAGNFAETSPNLPQRVVVFCEANTANQGTLDTAEWQATNLAEVGARYGYGSPAYHIARIALPIFGGIPLVFLPQEEAPGATAKVVTVTPTGTATENATHTLFLAGRDGLDGQFYNITVNEGDTAPDITAKITDAVNAVLGSPATASDNDYVSTLTTKWKGLTANDFNITIDTNGKDAGISYSIVNGASGAGTPSISDAIETLGTKWNTVLINGYGAVSAIMSALETYNGIPDPENPTSQYTGIIMRPLIALTGSVDEDASATTDARKNQCTIAFCPAPLSAGFPFEAAANYAALLAPMAQNYPELDILNKFLPDMPTPDAIGAMSDYNERDRIVKLGCSTVDLVNGKYQVKDFITTYHPTGVLVPQYRYVRDLVAAFNIRYGYYLLEQQYVVGHVISNDADIVKSAKVVKPKMWKQVLNNYFLDLTERGIIADPDFSKTSMTVAIDGSNPNRINTFFRVKLTGIARISATMVEMGFNFGTI